MFAQFPHREPRSPTAAWKAVISLGRLAAALAAAVICAGLASMAIVPATWAKVIPNDGSDQPPAGGVVTAGGMPGWQIALIALGAALVAAVVAVLLDRARAGHQAASARTA